MLGQEGDWHFESGRYGAAYSDLLQSRASMKSEDLFTTLMSRSAAFFELGDIESTRRDLSSALLACPKHVNVGEAYLRLGVIDDSLGDDRFGCKALWKLGFFFFFFFTNPKKPPIRRVENFRQAMLYLKDPSLLAIAKSRLEELEEEESLPPPLIMEEDSDDDGPPPLVYNFVNRQVRQPNINGPKRQKAPIAGTKYVNVSEVWGEEGRAAKLGIAATRRTRLASSTGERG